MIEFMVQHLKQGQWIDYQSYEDGHDASDTAEFLEKQGNEVRVVLCDPELPEKEEQ